MSNWLKLKFKYTNVIIGIVIFILIIMTTIIAADFPRIKPTGPQNETMPHIVFLIGEKEYKTNETLPSFANKELETRGFETTFVHADSSRKNYFPGLESALQNADLLFLSVRRRAMPSNQLALIREYLKAGKPMVAIRTSSHAFALRDNNPPKGHSLWPAFDHEVLGAEYKGHYQNNEGTQVLLNPEHEDHPVLDRIHQPSFQSEGTLYKSRNLASGTQVLLQGKAIVKGKQVTEPVAWTNTYRGRIFYTSLGHPLDFQQSSFRRLLVNSVYWALNMDVPGMVEIAANEEVAEYMRKYEGKGALGSNTPYIPPQKAVKEFKLPEDISIDLAASEPKIFQPVYLTFDPQGRLWVVQYNQFPDPAGLKVTRYDNYLRTSWDNVPAPPPEGVKGADRITMLTDSDGDGIFEKAEDVIQGLNMATSIAFGREGIWVLSPPYLLKYPDTNGDGKPDGGDPVVHLKGFGLQDTHSVANSLEWGPDGWLYGASGSTTIDTVSSAVTRNVGYQGQAIWRYHPETEIFEIFAEGGGNTFNVAFDAKGRLYSGNNGYSRAFHYKQGAYYSKGWGKHGALTNPYAFGYFKIMDHTGNMDRFTHSEIIYNGTSLPSKYKGQMISVNPMQNLVQVSQMKPDGSTFNTIDMEILAVTSDPWFRPVDITHGPDGAVYIADWYDDRLSHNDTRDTWHRSSGRIYRVRGKGKKSYDLVNFTQYSTNELIDLLSHTNQWHRRQALRLLGDRQDHSAIPRLRQIIAENEGQLVLEALWALHLSGGFNESWAPNGLNHANPHVRMWTVRLLGDTRDISPALAKKLATMAKYDTHPEVRSQLAATSKRLPGKAALPLIEALLKNKENVNDEHIPLQTWWALEAQAFSNSQEILAMFEDPALWNSPIVKEYILDRLMRRYIMAGGEENFNTAAGLLKRAPDQAANQQLMIGLLKGAKGTALTVANMPTSLQNALEQYQERIGGSDLALSLRQGNKEAHEKILDIIANTNEEIAKRLQYISILGEVNRPEAVPVLLRILGEDDIQAIHRETLNTLTHYPQKEIGKQVTNLYRHQLRADPNLKTAALELLVSRPYWTKELLAMVDSKHIHPDDIPDQLVKRMLLFNDNQLDALVEKYWPGLKPNNTTETQERVNEIAGILKNGQGHSLKGEMVYMRTCGTCHKLFDQGNDIGPDITGYDRNNTRNMLFQIIDPNAFLREGYVNYKVKTRDGRMLTGTIQDRSGGSVTLKSLGGQSTTIAQSQIEEMEALQQSIMPEGLLQTLSDQEVRDLFAYIQSKEKPNLEASQN